MFSGRDRRELEELQSRADAHLDRVCAQYEREISDLRADRARLLSTVEELSGAIRDHRNDADLRLWVQRQSEDADEVETTPADREFAEGMDAYLSPAAELPPDFKPLSGPVMWDGKQPPLVSTDADSS